MVCELIACHFSARLQSGSWSVELEVSRGGCMPSGTSPNRDAGMPVRLGLGINKKRGRGDMSGGLMVMMGGSLCTAMCAVVVPVSPACVMDEMINAPASVGAK
jgi:hypothetical protein